MTNTTDTQMTECHNDYHDHARYDDGEPAEGLSQCADCGCALHYDATIEDYQHDDREADDCFLVTRLSAASPCYVYDRA
jgi:hypothetical protein